jgi:hypothetical protein
MAKLSNAQKAGIVARVAAKQVGRSKTFGAVVKGGRATAAHTGRVMSQLWLEVTGFTFLALSAIGGVEIVREYLKYHAGKVGIGRVIVAICFTLMFAWFGISSFWRVSRLRKA